MTNYEKLKETLKGLIKLSENQEVEIKLSEIILKDGMKLFTPAEVIEVGVEIFKLDENGNQLVADNGEYEDADGKIIVVMDGKVAEIKEAMEDPNEVETPVEEAMEVVNTEVALESNIETRLTDLEGKFSKILELLDKSIKESEVMMSKVEELEKSPSEDSLELKPKAFDFYSEKRAHSKSAQEEILKLRAKIKNIK